MGQQFQGFSFQYPGLLRQGSRGSGVSVLQYMLALAAEFDPVLTPVQVDGIYGARTAQAVREYQRSRDLLADGIVGEQTWYALYGEYAGIERDLRNDSLNFPAEDAPAGTASRLGQYGRELELGDSDETE